MDKDLEKRLDRLEAKVDRLVQSTDPRLLAYGHAKDKLDDLTGAKGQKVKTFADAKREDREKLRDGYAESRTGEVQTGGEGAGM